MTLKDIIKKCDGKKFNRYNGGFLAAQNYLERLGFKCTRRNTLMLFECWEKEGYEMYVYFKNGYVVIEDSIHVLDEL